MNYGIKALALAAALSAAVAGCSSTTTTKAEPVVLENTNWMLPLPEKSECDTPPVRAFLSGNRLDGHNILFDKVATTRRMCGPEFMKLEDQMLTILRDARTVEMTEKELTFFDADGKKIQTLVPEVAGACY